VYENYLLVAGTASGFHIFDIAVPSNPEWLSSMEVPEEAECVGADNGYFYFGESAPFGSVVKVEFNPPDDIKNLGKFNIGYVPCLKVDGDWIYVPEHNGIGIIDAKSMEQVAYVDDIRVSAIDSADGYIYAAGHFELTVIDADPVEEAHVVRVVEDIPQTMDIDVSADYAYVSRNDWDSRGIPAGLDIIDISTPESAEIVNTVELPSGAVAVDVYNGYAYLATFDHGVQVVDISNTDLAHIVGEIDTPGQPRAAAFKDNYIYIADEGSLQVWDISNPASPIFVDFKPSPGTSHNLAIADGFVYATGWEFALMVLDIDPIEETHVISQVLSGSHSGQVAISEGFAYIANREVGLMIVDIDPPDAVEIVRFVEMPAYARGVAVSDGYAYVAASSVSGLPWESNENATTSIEIVDIDPIAHAYIVQSVPTPGSANRVAVAGDYVYIADKNSGLQIIDVSSIESAQIIGSIELDAPAEDLEIRGDYAFIAATDIGLDNPVFVIVDVSDPEEPHVVRSVETPFSANGITIDGDYAYIADFNTLQIYNINPVEEAYRIDEIPIAGSAADVAIYGDYAIISAGDGGIQIIKLNLP
ncbi:hypothetical protein KAU08_06285, partial [bacterium]|nr:hypothetical protein [bacterium]